MENSMEMDVQLSLQPLLVLNEESFISVLMINTEGPLVEEV